MRTYQKELIMPVSDQGIDKDTSSGVKVGELPLYYLVSAVLTKDEDNKIIAKPSTVRPIINTVIAIDDVGSKAAIKLKQGETVRLMVLMLITSQYRYILPMQQAACVILIRASPLKELLYTIFSIRVMGDGLVAILVPIM